MIISKLCTTSYSRESGSRRGSGLRRTLCLLALVAFYAVGAKADVAINATNFPDGNFRTYVSSNCDTDKDTYLSDDEIAAVTEIDVSRKSIASLKGIEYFTALTWLNCRNNQLASLDVSKNTALCHLYCYNNQLTSLDLSKNVELTYLGCDVNQLTALDVSKNTALRFLSCSGTQLTSLDVSKNTALEGLYCGGNQLTSLDVSKNTTLTSLSCGDNKLTSLDVSKNTTLTTLYCLDNQLKSLDVSKNTALKDLRCSINQLTSLDVSKNKALTYLSCENNQIQGAGMATLVSNLPTVTSGNFYVYNTDGTEGNEITTVQVAAAKAKGWRVQTSNGDDYPGVDPGIAIDATNFPDEIFRTYVSSKCDTDKDTYLSDNEIAKVTNILVSRESIASLKGIEYFTALTILSCGGNQLTSLDVSNNTALEELYCYSNQLTSLDVSRNTALTWLDCYNNQLTSLDVSKNTALTYLDCYNNQLASLDVSKNTALTELYCDNNQLTSLDMSKNTALKELHCNENQLTSLDVSKNTALTVLLCSYNQLTSLDVSKNTALTTLGCYNNQLTSLDVSENKALTSLSCDYNQLTSLDVSENKALTGLSCSNNQIQGAGMGKLVNSLPTVESGTGKFYVYNTDGTDGNRITTAQVQAAVAKGWSVKQYNGSWVDYPGVDSGIAIDATNFPDENFRTYVSSNCDTDKDTYLSDDEIAAVKEIDVSGKSIASLKGIEYFTALTWLNCDVNQLTALDVSKNTALWYLSCSSNQLTSLDVSKNTALTQLHCFNNKLATLDVSKNTALTSLDCHSNQLTSLDVSKNRVLTELIITYNQIRGAGMAKLVNSLLEVTNGKFYVTDGTDGNRITTVQVAAAEKKGWGVLTGVGDDYPGVDIPGDANGDGEVNAQDVDCLRDYILGLDPTPFSLESANLNGDGAVDIVDLTLLIEMLKD